ncbi:hypothetical protein AAG906_036743 [Vitis piasezkii]
MEEWETRRDVAAEEGDQPSRNSGQTGPGPVKEHRIDMDGLRPGLENWLLSVEDAEERTHQSQTQRGKRAKVPQTLRRIQDFEKFYEAMDLFLLENQLPFGVLKLFEGAKFQADWESKMEEMIKSFITSNTVMPQAMTLQLIKKTVSRKMGDRSEEKGKQLGNWILYRNMTELAAAGIHLKHSRTGFMKDISFESYFFGYLKLAPIIIDTSTKPKLLNLIAYEMCPNHGVHVMLLQSNYTLYNFLCSDEKVADLFNDIAKDLVPNPHVYADVNTGVQKHYKNRYPKKK